MVLVSYFTKIVFFPKAKRVNVFFVQSPIKKKKKNYNQKEKPIAFTAHTNDITFNLLGWSRIELVTLVAT